MLCGVCKEVLSIYGIYGNFVEKLRSLVEGAATQGWLQVDYGF